MQTLLILFSLFIFCSYLIYVVIRVGIQPSISDSWYALNKSALFTIAMWLTALPIIFVADNGLLFFCGAALCFVGAAAAFKESSTRTIHFIGAIVSIVLGFLAAIILYDGLFEICLSIIVMAIIEKLSIKNKTWWQEIAAYLAIISTLLIYYV